MIAEPFRTGKTRLRLQPAGWFNQPTLVHQTQWALRYAAFGAAYNTYWRDTTVADLTATLPPTPTDFKPQD